MRGGGPRPRRASLGQIQGCYLRLLAAALAPGLEFDDANGELETIFLVLSCFGFLASRLPRCCFWATSGLLLFVGMDPRPFRQACTICLAAVTR